MDRANQNILDLIVQESARLWKERNPEALPFGWKPISEWKSLGAHSKARAVRDNTGKGFEQVVGQGHQTMHRAREHDDPERKFSKYSKRKTPL